MKANIWPIPTSCLLTNIHNPNGGSAGLQTRHLSGIDRSRSYTSNSADPSYLTALSNEKLASPAAQRLQQDGIFQVFYFSDRGVIFLPELGALRQDSIIIQLKKCKKRKQWKLQMGHSE